MSTSRKLALGSAARVSHVMLATLAGFFMMPFLVGELGERWYGIWVAVGSLVGSYYLIDFGLASAVTRFVTMSIARKDADGVNQIINTALRIYCVLALLLILVTAGLVMLIPVIMEDPGDVAIVRHTLSIVGLTLALGFPFKAFAGIGQAHNRYDLLTLINIVSLAVLVAGSVVVVLMGYGILGLAYAGLGASMVTDLLLFQLVKRLFPDLSFSSRYFRRGLVRELFSYSSWSFVTQIADQVRLRIDALIVGALINASAVTHYFVGARLAELANNLLYQATNIVTPILTRYHAEGRRSEMQEAILFLTRINIVAGVFVSGGLCALGAAFIARWMGAEFLDAAPVLFTLTVAMTAAFIVNPLDNLLYAVARHRALALINIGDAIANLALSLLLGHWFGMWGVALGTLIPMLISRFMLVVPYSCRQIDLPLGRYFGEVLLCLGTMLLSVFGAALIARAFVGDGGYLRLIVLGGGMAALYGVCAWCFGLRQADRERLLSLLNVRRGVDRPV